ncbi:mitochondrial nicotinamide adenine dinucleotide transporter 2 [[Candida] railenensis]|uniref:Mitochondrial thiamine pyrophosphate carrier 1 n=1 Tax=[Candida] railenensis TaxID=45579 RepID=A0A9P0VZM4_9ASCO|nr:mitochondrial nicotinamide adenine dinucleotide transporter 2 [[Candida] railenensis]
MVSDRQIETISGLAAGFSTTIVTHPLDLIKVRLQLSAERSKYPFSLLKNVLSKIHETANIEYQTSKQQPKTHKRLVLPKSFYTLSQYYRGIGPNLIGNISAWGLYFTLYAEFKANLVKTDSNTVNYFASSTLAGVSTSLLTNPIWVLKTRILGSSKHDNNAYKSIFDGVKQILRTEGPKSFWKGTIPSMFSVFQASLQFTFYDHLKNYYTSTPSSTSTYSLSTGQYIYISATSKILSMVIMYPSQMVKARLQNYHGTGKTIVSVCKDIWHNEGKLKGFYKGVGANMIRVVPATCITLVVYESVKDLLKKRQ